MVKNIKFIKKQDLKIIDKITKKPIIEYSFECKKKIDSDALRDYCYNFSKRAYNEGFRGKISCSGLYEHDWRSGSLSNIGDIVDLYDPNDWYKNGGAIDFDGSVNFFNIYFYAYEQV